MRCESQCGRAGGSHCIHMVGNKLEIVTVATTCEQLASQ